MTRVVPSLAFLLAALALAAPAPGPAQEGPAADRKLVPDRYKWKLGELYPTDEAWAGAKAAFPKKLAGLDRF